MAEHRLTVPRQVAETLVGLQREAMQTAGTFNAYFAGVVQAQGIDGCRLVRAELDPPTLVVLLSENGKATSTDSPESSSAPSSGPAPTT